MAAEDSHLPHPTVTEPSEAETDPWVGQTVSSYKLIRRIGWGGMGVVYLAQHPNLDRYAAVKFLAAHLVVDRTYIDMFVREAKAAAKLNHPNIVAIYDCGSIGGEVYYLVMEYIEGKDLRTILRERLVLPVPEAVHYIRQVAAGLGYAHRKKIIHRDIKPENLMLTDERVVKIGDLGLAKWMGDESAALTQSGMVMGSPFYIAPERLRGEPDVNEATDIYSLGGTFFHLVTGKAPYDGTAPVVMAKHLDSPVSDPRDLNPSIDTRLAEIIQKMMAKDQKDRYQNMEELDRDLAEFELTLSHPVMKALPGKMESSAGMRVPEDARKSSKSAVVPPEEVVPTVAIRQPGEAKKAGLKWIAGIAAVLGLAAILGLPLLKNRSVPAGKSEFPAAQQSKPPPAEKSTTADKPAPAVAPAQTPTPATAEKTVSATKPSAPIAPSKSPAEVVKPAAAEKPTAAKEPLLLGSFEEGPEGWKIDWGFNMGGPNVGPEYAHHGTKSIAYRHHFKKDEESAAGFVVFKTPKDLRGYKEISGWIYIPEGQNTQWQLQMYVRSGKNKTTDWGKLYRAWLGGWHQVKFSLRDAEDPALVQEIGVQIKCFNENRATLFYDHFEALPK